MSTKIYQYVFLPIYFLFNISCNGQNHLDKSFSKGTSAILNIQFVDTIRIKDPILVKFKENQNTDSYAVQSVLVSTSYIDTIYKNISINYHEFLSSRDAYLFFTASRFSCIISNQSTLQDLPYYNKLQKVLQNAEKDTVWVKFDKNNYEPKQYHGLEYNEIYPRKFLFFLVKGSAIRQCQTLDEIVIKDMDNIYFKLLVPITW